MSTPINNGGPAYPCQVPQRAIDGTPLPYKLATGMTLRDLFAGHIIGGMCASLAPSNGNTPKDLADAAFELADAMIAAREAQQ
jgi:hypothetical protein